MGGSANGANEIKTNDLFTTIAKAHGCSPGVVSLSWAVQRGVGVIPKSNSHERLEENIKLVTLTDKEMDAINNAHQTIGRLRLADNITRLWFEVDGRPTLQGWTNVDFGWEDEEGNWLA
jgi:glycerol 2-dehydrogenase (NADP+)